MQKKKKEIPKTFKIIGLHAEKEIVNLNDLQY